MLCDFETTDSFTFGAFVTKHKLIYEGMNMTVNIESPLINWLIQIECVLHIEAE